MALLHQLLCNLLLIVPVNLTNFANFFIFSSFDSKSYHVNHFFFFFLNYYFDFSMILHLDEDFVKSEPTVVQILLNSQVHESIVE